jgi:hypothetical protein
MGIEPKVVIDLDINRVSLDKYLDEKLPNTQRIYFDSKLSYGNNLPKEVEISIDEVCSKYKITHAIVSTEPKSHACYLSYLFRKGIRVLCDKPLTSPVGVINDVAQAMRIRKDFDDLNNVLNKHSDADCIIQCQRRWHPGYNYLKSILEECIEKYNVPITNVEIYHCDGMWNMPEEFFKRENHPYKYGYGKLMHSGYHFIDLLCWLTEINDCIIEKRANNAELYATASNPYDFFNVITSADYKNFFESDVSKFLNRGVEEARDFGEIDFQALLQFKNDDAVITTCQLNLLQNGFSRRSWNELPEDTYKSNGRIRHERINIQVGPLMNIQVHSYQSVEAAERTTDHSVGNVEHFEIYIFRNSDLIGGKPFEKVSVADLTEHIIESDFIGYNELARKKCLQEFLSTSGVTNTSSLRDHKRSIELLSQCYKSLAHKNNGLSPVIHFSL